MEKIECPVCGEMVQIPKKPKKGICFPCPICDSILQIIMTNPIEVDVFDFEGEERLFGFGNPEKSAKVDLVKCPVCKKLIHLESRVWIGDRITCGSCGSEYQVVGLNPIEIDIPYDGDDLNLMDDDHDDTSFDLYKTIRF